MAEQTAEPVERDVRNYVDGQWIESTAESGQAVRNPATGSEIGWVPFTERDELDQTVARARDAFEEWSTTPVEERIQPLFRLKSLLEENLDELARILVTEHGKTVDEARGEIRRGIENVEVACGIPSMMQSGHLSNAAPGIDETAIRKPIGVFAAITPFNFPAMIPLWFLPYAVATGNTFVLKPSEKTPLTANYLFELIEEAGFPDGVVNLVNGSKETVEAILEHDDIAGVSFVGSTPVAKTVYETASENGKRVQAQGGAKNYVVVSESANLEHAAEKILSAACACAGERCLALDIAVVHRSVYEEFADLLVERADRAVVGNGLDSETDIGALISPEHRRAVSDSIRSGVEEGATILRDGRDDDVDTNGGNFLGPTVLGDVTTDMTIAQEEIFGPVVGLASTVDIDDAIDQVNSSRFGNAASIFTERGREAKEFRHRVDAGNVGVNVGTVAPMAFFHFGGRKESFFGDLHAQGQDMIYFYTDETIYVERWPDRRDDP